MSVVVVANLIPAEGQMDAVEAILTSVVPAVHEEDGCELYALHRADDRFVFVERWRDADALAVHGAGATIKAMRERLAGLLVPGPAMMVLDAVPAGDPVKGAL